MRLKYHILTAMMAAVLAFLIGSTGVLAQEEGGPSAEAIAAAEGAFVTPEAAIREQAVGAAAEAAQEALDAGEDAAAAAADSIAVTYAPFINGPYLYTTLLFLMGGFLVMWMACGFAMLEAGLVRSKNVTTQLTKNIGLFSLAAIAYYLVGYNLMYPLGDWSIGTDETGGYLGILFSVAKLEAVGIGAASADDIGYASTGSDYFFQLMFCAATASIVSGALAERIKLWPFLIFTVILTGLIYPDPGVLEMGWRVPRQPVRVPRLCRVHRRALGRRLGGACRCTHPWPADRQIHV